MIDRNRLSGYNYIKPLCSKSGKNYVKCIFRENVLPKNVIKPFSSKSRLKIHFDFRFIYGKERDRVTCKMFLNSDF